jgi:hypothetical protein
VSAGNESCPELAPFPCFRKQLRVGFAQRSEDVGGVLSHVSNVVHRGDDSLGIDEIRMPFRKVRVLMIWFADHLIRRTNCSVNVGEQWVRETLGVPELFVVRCGVKGSAEDAAIGGVKIFGSVTQGLTLNRSTRC